MRKVSSGKLAKYASGVGGTKSYNSEWRNIASANQYCGALVRENVMIKAIDEYVLAERKKRNARPRAARQSRNNRFIVARERRRKLGEPVRIRTRVQSVVSVNRKRVIKETMSKRRRVFIR